MRPSFLIDGKQFSLGMSAIIEIIMLSAALILLVTKTDGIKSNTRLYLPGWNAGCNRHLRHCLDGRYIPEWKYGATHRPIEGIVRQMPWLFGIALFVMSILLYGQAATVRALVPLGIALGISPYMLIAMFPAVNGYFFIPNCPYRSCSHQL